MMLHFIPNESAKRKSILNEVDNVRVATLTYDNNDLYLIHNALISIMKKYPGNHLNEWERCNLIYDKLIDEYPYLTNHPEDYLKCLILYEICDY